jgi:diguanylate cyclase (GGDEF)-like protein
MAADMAPRETDVRVRSSFNGSTLDVGSAAAARQASLLFLAAGLMTLINNHISDANYHGINDIVGILAIVASPVGLFLPWGRWPARSTLVYFPFCLTLLVMSAAYGSTPREIYAFWYVVAFVWVGMHHRSRTSLALGAPAAIAYLIPLLTVVQPSAEAIQSVVIAIPGAVLIGEILSATTSGLRRARAGQQEAFELLAVAAVTDDLTGVGNRRHVNTLLDTLQPGDALLLLDIDHFKDINDRLGHLAGDEVLADLGRYLKVSTRDSADTVARYGGEEFLIVLRQPGDLACRTAERLLEGWRASEPLVTFSVGIALHPHHTAAHATLHEADQALYQAKASGRDRCQTALSPTA